MEWGLGRKRGTLELLVHLEEGMSEERELACVPLDLLVLGDE